MKMHCTATVICIIACLSFLIQDLDALQPRSSFRNGLKRRSKRDDDGLESDGWNESCNDADLDQCEAHPNTTAASVAVYMARWGTYEERGQSGYGNNRDSFGKNGMCRTNKCLFNFNGFFALMNGHTSLLQAGAEKLFPVESFTIDDLVTAEYIKLFGDTYVMTEIGLLALNLNHITPSQLSELNLYPLQPGSISSEVLLEAGYINKECFSTALGLLAIKTRYIQNKDFSEFGCQPIDHSEISASHLQNAKYIYGVFSIVTPIGLAAMHTGHLQLSTLRRVGAFCHDPSYSSEHESMFNTRGDDIIRNLIRVGYVQHKSYLITNSGYSAIVQKAVKVEYLRRLKLWPCPGTLTMSSLISAQYVSSCGHLTRLGYSLLHARYYSIHWLTLLGVQFSTTRHVLYHAIAYGHSLKPFPYKSGIYGSRNDETERTGNSQTFFDGTDGSHYGDIGGNEDEQR